MRGLLRTNTMLMFPHWAYGSLIFTFALLLLLALHTFFIEWVVFEQHKAVWVYEEWWQLGLGEVVIYRVWAFAVLRSTSLLARASRTSLDKQRVRRHQVRLHQNSSWRLAELPRILHWGVLSGRFVLGLIWRERKVTPPRRIRWS